MPGAAGLVGGEVLGAFGVVEDQQPAGPAAQLPQDQLDRARHGRSGGQAELVGQLGELVADQGRLLGVDPPHQVVVGGEPVGVLDGELGLAHPAQAVQGLHHQRVLAGVQPLVELLEQASAAGEVRVAQRHVPRVREPGRL